MKKNFKIIGLMSGTSVDGLDIAYVDIKQTSKLKVKLLAFETIDLSIDLKAKIFNAFNRPNHARYFCSLNFEIGQFYAQSINKFLTKHQIDHQDVDYIASHGQTIYHLIDPNLDEVNSTWQTGDISVIAKLTKIKTIGDFRPSDMALNGQGAPLVVYPDYLLFKSDKEVRLLQNIGGMANVTVLENKLHDVYAFDNGPGNVLIDMAMKHFYNLDYDFNGVYASRGKINYQIINYLNQDNYYQTPPPKSTGREKYNLEMFNNLLEKFNQVSPNDIIASLSYFSALTIANSYKQFVFKENQTYSVYLSGGGAFNRFIIKHLKQLLPNINIQTTKALKINPDAKEAIEFAVLGYLFANNLTGNIPKATGASDFTILGKLAMN